MRIPVYVNVFNRLTTTSRLCDQIASLDHSEVIVVDNASTFEPLRDWLRSCPYRVVHLPENIGHHAPWKSGVVSECKSLFYAVTDCDLDIGDVPRDCLSHLSSALKNRGIVKSGLSLEIDDLPAWQEEVVQWESQFWRDRYRRDKRFFSAWVDTTFAVYRRSTPHNKSMGVTHAVRSDRPYTARHCPWYLKADELDDEELNYFRTSNSSNSWIPCGVSLTQKLR